MERTERSYLPSSSSNESSPDIRQAAQQDGRSDLAIGGRRGVAGARPQVPVQQAQPHPYPVPVPARCGAGWAYYMPQHPASLNRVLALDADATAGDDALWTCGW